METNKIIEVDEEIFDYILDKLEQDDIELREEFLMEKGNDFVGSCGLNNDDQYWFQLKEKYTK